ncbi:MAG: hypothetical protein H0V44_02125 [Planctomycetes bacterium]|nr:hypothetical protein [Planctomycetota bacterium]
MGSDRVASISGLLRTAMDEHAALSAQTKDLTKAAQLAALERRIELLRKQQLAAMNVTLKVPVLPDLEKSGS